MCVCVHFWYLLQEVHGGVTDKPPLNDDNLDILGADYPHLKKQYGQTDESVSFYQLLQQIQEMGLEDV